MAKKRKRQRKRLHRVPVALRKVYGDLVQTLEAAILSLLPPPPSSPTECRCRGRLCVGCGTHAYLLRQDDPPDYRILLTRGLCVLSCDAPPPPRVFHGDDAPQRVLVRNARELILDNMLETMNVLCNGHNKESHFNIAGEFLCTSTWDLLLHRIGFQLMVFLLRFSSIFIPVRNKSYYQVTGHPMDKIFEGSKFLKATSTSSNQQPFFPEAMQNMGCLRSLKRKRGDKSWRSNMGTAAVSVCSKSKNLGGKRDNGSKVSCGKFERVGGRTEVVQFDGGEPNIKILCDHDSSQNTLSKCGGPILHDSVFQSYFDKLHLEKQKSPCTKSHNNEKELICTVMPGLYLSRKSRKHGRLYSWQRRRKYKGPEENVPGQNNKIRLQMKFLDSDCSLCHWASEPPVPASTEEDIMKDFELTASKDTEASREKCSHLMLSQDMCQRQLTFSTKKTHHRPRSETDDGSERQHHASLKNLSIQPMDFVDSSLYNNHFTPNELFPEESDFSASKNQLNLHTHFEKVGSMCFYCLIMQSSQKVEIRDQIDRSFIFYNRSSAYTVFPKNHILNILKPNNRSAIRLMKHIFGFPDRSKNFVTCTDCSIGCAIESQCLYHFLLGLLKSLIRNAQRCQCKKLLLKHCIQTSKLHRMDENRSKSENSSMKMKNEGRPSAQEALSVFTSATACTEAICFAKKQPCHGPKAGTESSLMNIPNENAESQYASCHMLSDKLSQAKLHHDDKPSDLALIESYSMHHQVVSFIWAVCRSIVPVSLLGNSSCWKSLQRNISKFVKLHRFEKFYVNQCIHGVKMSCFHLLSKVRSSECSCNGNNRSEFGGSIRKDSRKSCNSKMILVGNLFSRWMRWFFFDMIVPMISANFYVTERESIKHELFYYPKPVWRTLVQRTIASLEGDKFKLVNQVFVRHIISKRSFGFSKVKFLPKNKCLRLLANHGASSMVRFSNPEFGSRYCSIGAKEKAAMHQKYKSAQERGFVRCRSVNSALREVYAVLRRVKVEKPEILGSSVFDYNDVHQKLHQFLSKIKSRTSKMPEIYIVVADVLKAFDSIDQDMLIGILKDIFQNDEYVMRKHVKISCRKKSLRILHDHVYCAYSSCNCCDSVSVPSVSAGNILIDQGISLRIQKEKLLYLLREHLKCNILQVGQNFYLQKVGISHGSVLSSLLCSYYYAHMERSLILPYLQRSSSDLVVSTSKYTINECTTELANNTISGVESLKYNMTCLGHPNITDLGKSNLLPFTEHHATEVNTVTSDKECSTSWDNLLLRLIDDFFFISTSKKQAARFFNRMTRGFRAYNCYMNKKKFGTNFGMTQNHGLSNRIYSGADGILFLPWSGLLINCQTLEIQADYTRYFGINIRSTLTIKLHAKPCYHLKEKLLHFVKTRCHPIFYDSNINSPATVSLNAYQAFLLCAMKFHCYIHSMQDVTKLKPSYLLEIIERSFRCMYKHIMKLMMHDMLHHFGIHPSLGLPKREVLWLGLSAYICVLRKKQSRYKELISLLRSRIATYGRIEDVSSHLRYAVDESHSSFFSKIKF
ncbi:Telomerase reverse transcriptase [Musa troglodytarum]|uniref:Telomerase reverse transcriptase n=2 Tax=Musa troglodytarum TaxID=320322 RepID=A0A9E7F8Z1_9LILI|nr:Telomerase reverse transcriptase [Musa troglodytarum]